MSVRKIAMKYRLARQQGKEDPRVSEYDTNDEESVKRGFKRLLLRLYSLSIHSF